MAQLIKSCSAQHVYCYSFEYSGSWRFGDLVTMSAKNIVPKLIMGKMGMKVREIIEKI